MPDGKFFVEGGADSDIAFGVDIDDARGIELKRLSIGADGAVETGQFDVVGDDVGRVGRSAFTERAH